METPILLDIISPERTLVHENVSFVALPGVAGAFEVLKNHAPLITSLEAGDIRYGLQDGEKRLRVKSGFVEVKENHVTVCVEEA
jgi:F-type H+-transporting ATPase subunit epsilon